MLYGPTTVLASSDAAISSRRSARANPIGILARSDSTSAAGALGAERSTTVSRSIPEGGSGAAEPVVKALATLSSHQANAAAMSLCSASSEP